MRKLYKIKRGDLIFTIIFMFLIGVVIGSALAPKQPVLLQNHLQPAQVEGERIVEMGLPAVDADGNGVVGKLVMRIRPGSGQVLVNINDVLAQFDTQLSGRIAAKAASNYTKIDLGSLDIIYDIKVNATAIEGPSAGAAMASSIVLALKDIPATNKIMMTGTILENGTIGPVGAILEKARAAKEAGATIFLVPKGQSTQLTSKRMRDCKQFDGIEVCQITYKYGQVNVGQSINITVEEVNTIDDIIKFYKD